VHAHSEQSRPDDLAEPAKPIELQTENGFSIVRRWEADNEPAPAGGSFAFLVRNPEGLTREIIVEISNELRIRTEIRIRELVISFWVSCAEHHLANYLWTMGDYPASNRLLVERFDPDDIISALRWNRSSTAG
jgi:hypothetical protein